MKAKVLNERYQVVYELNGQRIEEEVSYKDAYWRAFLLAGTNRCKVYIIRVTTVETPEEYNRFSSFLDQVGETIEVQTGQVIIDEEHFATDTKLSRYNPNNGWVIPECIDIDK